MVRRAVGRSVGEEVEAVLGLKRPEADVKSYFSGSDAEALNLGQRAVIALTPTRVVILEARRLGWLRFRPSLTGNILWEWPKGDVCVDVSHLRYNKSLGPDPGNVMLANGYLVVVAAGGESRVFDAVHTSARSGLLKATPPAADFAKFAAATGGTTNLEDGS